MQPEAQRLLEIAQNVDSALATTSSNDPTFRALLHELKHQESVEQFCREQNAGIPDLVTEMSGRFETQSRELDAARARIVDLEGQIAMQPAGESSAPSVVTSLHKPPQPIRSDVNAG